MIALIIQHYVYLAFGLLALGIEIWALVDCVRRKPEAFEAASKRTKSFWLGMTVASAVVGALAAWGSALPFLFILQIVAVVAASVYLADVKPAVDNTRRGYNSW